MSAAAQQVSEPTFRYHRWLKLGLISGAILGSAGLLSYALLAIGKSGALAAAGKTAATQLPADQWMGKLFDIIFPILAGLLTSLLVAYQQSRTIKQQKKQQKTDKQCHEQRLTALEEQLDHLQTELKKTLANMSATQKEALAARYDLQRIKGIGPKLSQALQAGGIHTIEDLAHCSSEDLQALLKAHAIPAAVIQKHKVDQWVEQAQQASLK